MIANLHISHNSLTNASRLLKETQTIVRNRIADYIYIVGKFDENIAEKEKVDNFREIRRVKLITRFLPKSLLFQLVKYIEFTTTILLLYRNKQIKFVNCHSLSVLPIGLLFKIIFKVKVIYDTHELETETYGLIGLRKRLSEIVERNLIKFVDQIFVVGERIANEYAIKYNIKRPTVVLNCPNYTKVNHSNFFRDKFSIEESALIFLYQGVLSEGRGISLILDAFSSLNTKKYVVIFLGYGALEDKIKHFSLNHENIHFHKAVHPDEIIKFTASADIGLSLIEGDCLSYQYCLPNKLFEYIMAGLPVVVTDLPEMKKIVEMNRIGYILKNNTTSSLIRLIKNINSENRNEFKNNTANVAMIYNWEKQENSIIKAYSNLLSINAFY